MLEVLRNLLKETNSILALLRRGARNAPVSLATIERIQELVLTWSVNVRPGLVALKIPSEVLERADRLTSRLARLAAGTTDYRSVTAVLALVRAVFHEQVLEEVARIPPGAQAAFLPPAPAQLFPEISDLPNQLVPYAIQGWTTHIRGFLKKNPFGKNVFIMVSYRTRLDGFIVALKRKLVELELNPVLARDHSLTNDLYNPVACLLCCSYGVAVFDRPEVRQTHNPNVVYELGMMQLLKRPCVILKNRSLRKMPTDLLSILYEDYSSQAEAVRKLAAWWERTNL